jgi:hypothetical protein
MSDQTELQAIAKYIDRLGNRTDGDFLRGIAAKLAAAEADAATQRDKVRVMRHWLSRVVKGDFESEHAWQRWHAGSVKALATTEDV